MFAPSQHDVRRFFCETWRKECNGAPLTPMEALAVRIALEEAAAPRQLVRVDFAAGQQRTPEYLAINPKGRVPALVTPQGTLTETPALYERLRRSGWQRMDERYSIAAFERLLSNYAAPRRRVKSGK